MGDNKLSVACAIACNYGILETYLESLSKVDLPQNTKFLFCVDGVNDIASLKLIDEFRERQSHNVQVVSNNYPMGFTKSINKLMEFNESEYTLLMDSDVILTPDCVQYLFEEISRDDVAAVQPLLLYPQTMKIQSYGHVFGNNFNRHTFAGRSLNDLPNLLTRDAQGITTACQLFKTELFRLVEGLDPEYYNAFGGLDLALRFREKGYKTLASAKAIAYHFQGKTRSENGLNQSMACSHFWVKWKHLISADFFKFYSLSEITNSKALKVINVSNLPNWDDFIPLDLSEQFTIRNRGGNIDCFEDFPYYYLDFPGTLLFLCDHYSQVSSNKYWFALRKGKPSIVLDLHGNQITM